MRFVPQIIRETIHQTRFPLTKHVATRQRKIFCISLQRTGTTSTGKFFRDHGFRVADWDISHRNDWTRSYITGDYEAIFSSSDFLIYKVFEDEPWWIPDFYKVLYHRVPNARFILMRRDPDRWFDSMKSHDNERTLSNTYTHCKIYRREKDLSGELLAASRYSSEIDTLLPLNDSHREHYKHLYTLFIEEMQEFFAHFGSEKLFSCRLEDPLKWIKLGNFFGIDVAEDYNVHENRSVPGTAKAFSSSSGRATRPGT